MAQRPNITLQIVPLDAGAHAAAGGPFTILRFAEPDLPDIVYLERLTNALYLDKNATPCTTRRSWIIHASRRSHPAAP